jgi:hypothetical protein
MQAFLSVDELEERTRTEGNKPGIGERAKAQDTETGKWQS